MMEALSANMGFHHENSTPYYPQTNGKVKAINKVLKTMMHRMVGDHKSSWHLTLFYALWDCRILIKTTTGLTPFQLVYGLEVVLPIECEIPLLKLAVNLLPNTSTEEECFLYLTNLGENKRDVSLANEAHKRRIKVQYDKTIQPRLFSEG